MVKAIDMLAHPGFIAEINDDPERLVFRRKHFGLYKQHIWPLELFIAQMDCAGIEKAALAAEDLTARTAGSIVSNDEVKRLVDMAPDRFFGLASVDPNRQDAEKELDRAFGRLGMKALVLNPCNQQFFPDEAAANRLYEICLAAQRPVIFQMGISLQPNAPAKYGAPILLEDIAIKYPELKICISHFGWPWVVDTAALCMKYENVYADLAMLFFDSPAEFFEHTFGTQLGKYWVDRTLHDKIMFASNYPRIEQHRMADAVKSLALRPLVLDRVLRENAINFLGGVD